MLYCVYLFLLSCLVVSVMSCFQCYDLLLGDIDWLLQRWWGCVLVVISVVRWTSIGLINSVYGLTVSMEFAYM